MVLFCHLRVDRWCMDAMERPCVWYLSMKWKQFCFSAGSHRVSISLAVVQSTRLVFIFCCNGFVGMLVCILLIAKEANLKLLSVGVSWRSCIWCFVLLMWKRIGEGDICWCSVSEGNFAGLKAEAFCELTTGAVNPLTDGAVGFSLQYFHLFSFDIITLMFFYIRSKVPLTHICKLCTGSWKYIFGKKFLHFCGNHFNTCTNTYRQTRIVYI